MNHPQLPDEPDTPGTPEPPGGSGALGLPGLDLDAILGMAQQVQQQLAAAQDELAETEVEGSAGGGLVKVRATGGGEFRSITIHPEAVDPDDVETLEDLVLAAVRDAMARVLELQAGASPLGGLGGLGGAGGPGGLDLGGLLGGEGP